MYISEVLKNTPKENGNPLESKAYKFLVSNDIEFERVDNDEVEAMEECVEIAEKLGSEIRKTVVACNRKKTDFYIVILPAEKRFDTKRFSKALECSRVSFASADIMQEKLGVVPGSATIMSVLNDEKNEFSVVIDKEVADEEYFACNTGTNTTHIKIKTRDLMEKLLNKTNHKPVIVEL